MLRTCRCLLLACIACFGLGFPSEGAPANLTKSPLALQQASVNSLSSKKLQWRGAKPEMLAFMRKVYDQQRQQASRVRKPIGDLAPPSLAVIEGNLLAEIDAAQSARNLLKAARLELQRAQPQGVKGIGVLSAYRRPSRQFINWQQSFPNYYRSTLSERQALPDGEFGEAAVEYMSKYIQKRLASPGFSLHNRGLAIDFKSRENGRLLIATTSKENTGAWHRSWLYAWLKRNAGKYRFYINPYINEPWHWEYRKSSHLDH